jgi:hypothetical protein
MTNLRQAAQQALEAMDKATRFMSDSDYKKLNQAIDDLRAALAEPDYWQEEARRYAGNADYWRKRYKALAEPEQEPVAWIWKDGTVTVDPDRADGTWTPLYTAPTPRKPLPLKEVERLIYEHTKINPNIADDRELLGYIVNAVRAIERKHGIGEQHEP